ncbi:hypothetical protein GCM10010398_40280 [Streptomyces fimbriatus]
MRSRGAERVRRGSPFAGDVLAVVLQSRKGTARAVPFRRTVVLRSRLPGRAGEREGAPHPTGAGPGRVSWGPALCTRTAPPLKEHPVVIFFEALLVLVAVGVLAFAGLTVKKLYQGQR